MKIICVLGLMIAALTFTALQPTRAEASATLDFNANFTYDGAQIGGTVTFSDNTYTDIVGVNLVETESIYTGPETWMFTVVGSGNPDGEIRDTGEYNWELFTATGSNVLDIAWTIPAGSLPVIDFDGALNTHNITDNWTNDMVSGTFSNGTDSPVPIPASLLLLGPGIAGLAAVRRRFEK